MPVLSGAADAKDQRIRSRNETGSSRPEKPAAAVPGDGWRGKRRSDPCDV